jgi:formate dehydrogenase iron-sulfur subunit
MKQSRRSFLKLAGLAAGGSLLGRAGRPAGASGSSGGSGFGMLLDTTRCVGCRSCEAACREKQGLPEPESMGDDGVFEKKRDTDAASLTVINRFEADGSTVFAKKQCLHCLDPACVSACLVRAMIKTPEGPVIWRPDRCMGCRYCMIACPFSIPKFEYESPVPRIVKCDLCHDLILEGKQPACAEACPAEAITFGRRDRLLEEAGKRIREDPDRYVKHVFGKSEAGGLSVLYLASVPFSSVGLRTDVESRPYPELTRGFLSAAPLFEVSLPVLLLGVYFALGRKGRGEKREES